MFTDTQTDRQMTARLVYYKLTLSGELITNDMSLTCLPLLTIGQPSEGVYITGITESHSQWRSGAVVRASDFGPRGL